MRVVPAMADMRRTEAEKEEAAEAAIPTAASMEDYPWGLRICLTEAELAKIGFESGELEVGDMVHLHCFATVTSCSENSTDQGKTCRVEMTLTHISAEDEDEENEEEEAPRGPRRLYA